MQELVKIVAQKVGIPEEAARVAIETVVSQLKKQLPESMAVQIDVLFAGAADGIDAQDLSALAGIAKSFFDK
jgi:spore maturation protein SpmB